MPILQTDPKYLTAGDLVDKLDKNPNNPDPQVQKLKKVTEIPSLFPWINQKNSTFSILVASLQSPMIQVAQEMIVAANKPSLMLMENLREVAKLQNEALLSMIRIIPVVQKDLWFPKDFFTNILPKFSIGQYIEDETTTDNVVSDRTGVIGSYSTSINLPQIVETTGVSLITRLDRIETLLYKVVDIREGRTIVKTVSEECQEILNELPLGGKYKELRKIAQKLLLNGIVGNFHLAKCIHPTLRKKVYESSKQTAKNYNSQVYNRLRVLERFFQQFNLEIEYTFNQTKLVSI